MKKVLAFLTILALAGVAQADWDSTMPAKWAQLPDLSQTGMDVRCGRNPVDPYLKTLADDFLCTETGPITGIHIWGSWLHDYVPFGVDPTAVEFHLSLHEDIPADQSETGYSMPVQPAIWEADFMLTQFQVRVEADNLIEQFYDPNMGEIIGSDTICYQYNFDLTQAGVLPPMQLGTPDNPIVYWLDVTAKSFDENAVFGWKTSLDHWNDDAVYWDDTFNPMPQELIYPYGHPMAGQSIDLAFVIVPEPTTIGMLAMGGLAMGGLALIHRRRGGRRID
jgi:hypothetical protein